MENRTLGTQGLTVSCLGLGLVGMSGLSGMPELYGPTDERESISTIHRALDLGITLLDTAEAYGPFTNEKLVGRAIAGKRDKVVLSTKFGFSYGGNGAVLGTDSRPESLGKALDASLLRLGVEHIDIWYQHRIDPEVPIEDTVGAMGAHVKRGKVRFLGLCEIDAGNLVKAHRTFPISVVQSEYSLWERGLETSVLDVLRRLEIGLVPHTPLGRGFLAGNARRAEDYPRTDFRSGDLRLRGGNFQRNLASAAILQEVAAQLHATPAQVALAWLLHQWSSIVPIPGTRRISHLEENLEATALHLDARTLEVLDGITRSGFGASKEKVPKCVTN